MTTTETTTGTAAGTCPATRGTSAPEERTTDEVVAAGGRYGEWEELVRLAVLGTGRRQESPGALLDAAAVQTVRRRAGLRPAEAGPRPGPAPRDPRPAPPAAARRRLAQLLSGRTGVGSGGGRRGAAPDLTELLPQWLAAAGRHGYRAPHALVPALLDAARARTDLRAPALALAGARGLWLARLNPDWRFALRGGAGGAGEPPGPEDRVGVEKLWQEGLFAERVALLGAVRAHEPPAATRLLSTTWATERAEDRLMFLDSLRVGLSGGDEPFLEAALGDRSRNVRATAAELLSALPESALAGRMAERALACVGPDGVVPPAACDAGMLRDGVVERPPAGRGERAWWLGQLVEAAPLSCWRERFGGLGPEEMVALPVAGGESWREELHAAWCRAAVRQRDPQWSKALLGSASAPPATAPGTASLAERAKLLSVLPDGERAQWVAEFIRAHGLSEAFQLLGVCVVPWAGTLGRAVVDALDAAREAGSYPWSFSGVMGLAERCLDPEEAEHLEAAVARGAGYGDPAEAASGAAAYWAEAFQRLVATLRLRAVMLSELTPA